jgi:hypothetical protein
VTEATEGGESGVFAWVNAGAVRVYADYAYLHAGTSREICARAAGDVDSVR